MSEKYKEFTRLCNIGAQVCLKLKNVYYPTITWDKCYKDVARIYSVLRKKARIILHSKSDDELLRQLAKMPDDDLKMLIEDYN